MIGRKKVSSRKIILTVMGVFLLIYALSLLMPLFYMVNNSFKRFDDFLERNAWSLPRELHFKNYKDVFKMGGSISFTAMIMNSVIFTFSAVAISTATTTATAYVLAKYRFRGRELLVALGVGALVLPDLGSSSVVYKLFLDWEIMDTWLILIKYTTAYGLNFLMLFSLFCTISKSYTEAAEIDGAGEMTVFLRICLPMAKGMVGAVMVLSAINCWNDYYTPYMYLSSIKTLSVGLQELSMTISQFDRPKLFAGMVLSVTPVVLLFVLMRDTIILNTAGGGIKG